MKNYLIAAVVAMALACQLAAQTRIDLRNQTKLMDFSQTEATRPMQTGTALPATCLAGELYLLLSAPAGTNIYACISANVWVAQDGGAVEDVLIPKLVDYVAAVCQKGVAASAFNTVTGSAPTAQCEPEAGESPIYGFLIFPAGATVYRVQDSLVVPATSQTITGKIVWRTTATTGSALWQMQTACTANPAIAVWTTPQMIGSQAPLTAREWQTASINLTSSGCSGKRMFWRLTRASNDFLDTLAAPADLVHILFDIQ